MKTEKTTFTKKKTQTIVVNKWVHLVWMARGLYWVIPTAFVLSGTKIFKPIFSMSLFKQNNERCEISSH